jgi:two-component system sensor histidine kinase YesM
MKDKAAKHAFLSLGLRLPLYFMLVAIIPIALILSIYYFLSEKNLKENATQFSYQSVSQIANEIDGLLRNTVKIANMVGSDPIVQTTLRAPLEQDMRRRYASDLKTDSRLSFIQSYIIDEIFGIYVIGNNGGTYKSNYVTFKDEDLRGTDWYDIVIHSPDPVWFKTSVGSPAVQTMQEYHTVLGVPIKDKKNGSHSGIVLVDLQEELIYEKINKSQFGGGGYLVVVAEDGSVISHPQREMVTKQIDASIPFKPSNLKYGEHYYRDRSGKEHIIVSRKLISGWSVLGVISTDALFNARKTTGVIVLLTMVILSSIVFKISLVLSRNITNPMKTLIVLMKRVEDGDLSVQMGLSRRDEIGQLGQGFNVMIKRISALLSEVRREQIELRKAELRVLQSQINPHFLYNTLDSIIGLSSAKRNQEVITMVTALTKQFRIALSKGQDVISVAKELEHIANYLTIQHIRYKSKLSYKIEVPAELQQFRILKLVLQPIVENAIYHGVK